MTFLRFSLPLGNRYKLPFPVLLWFLLAFVAVLIESLRHSINNYYIFKGVFDHTLLQSDLYTTYPGEYSDTNHYGPLFSLVIAPFSLLPSWLGVVLWSLTNAFVLFYAIKQLAFTRSDFHTVLLICAVELMTSTHHVQFNPMVAGWMILSYVMVRKEKDAWAALFIAAGFLCKLYGIAGLTFFLFSRHKVKFVLYFLLWLVILFCLPMLLSSPAFILHSYQNWFHSLIEKDAKNAVVAATNGMQDVSVIGMIRRVWHTGAVSDIMVIAPAAVLFALPLLRFSRYKHEGFQLRYLALCLISVVIFSSSAESVTYIIALAGVAVWYVQQEKKTWLLHGFMVFLFLVTVFSPTDLVPRFMKLFIRAYALKALPCFIVWLLLLKEVTCNKFSDSTQSPAA